MARPLTYIQKSLWIRNEAGREVPFLFNSAQRYLIQQKRKAIAAGRKRKFIVLKGRRMGVTTLEQSLSYAQSALHSGQYCVTLADTDANTAIIFDMATMFYDTQEPSVRPTKKTANERLLNFHKMRSKFYIGTAGSKAFGRGSTLQRVHGSEVAYWRGKNVKSLLAGLVLAARKGEVALESTANGVGNEFHTIWNEAETGENDYTPIFLPWWIHHEYVAPLPCDPRDYELTEEESDLSQMHGWTLEQVEWRRQMKKALGALYDQEYPEDAVSAFLVAGMMFFDMGVINDLASYCDEPIETRDAGAVKIWKKPVAGHQYVAGGDVAEGIQGGDFSGIGIIDRKTCEQVASLHGRWRPEVFAEKAVKLANEYNKALLAIEANNHGHSALNTAKNKLHYPRLFKHTDYDAKGKKQKQKKLGWQTTSKTRPLILDELAAALEDDSIGVNDMQFLSECKTFVDNGTGKYEADTGFHDDSVMKWAIAWYVRCHYRTPRIS